MRVLQVWTEMCYQNLSAVKCKPYDIYRKMFDVCRKDVLVKKMFTNAWVEKTAYSVEMCWLVVAGKEKVPGAAVSKEVLCRQSSETWKDPSFLSFLNNVQLQLLANPLAIYTFFLLKNHRLSPSLSFSFSLPVSLFLSLYIYIYICMGKLE